MSGKLPDRSLFASSAATSALPFHMHPAGGLHPTEKALTLQFSAHAQVFSKMD